MTLITTDNSMTMRALGQAANAHTAKSAFNEYRARLSDNTLRRHDAGLSVFARYLELFGMTHDAAALATVPAAWTGITHGLLKTFIDWMLNEGYAVSTVNDRLSVVKTYARLAFKAGIIDATEHVHIQDLKGYAAREMKHIDTARESSSVPTRKGAKKAAATRISADSAKLLKRDHADNPQGRRDALLMALLLDMGLRVGEVALLTVSAIDLKGGTLKFYRPKVDKMQEHKLSPDTLKAARAYLKGDAPLSASAPLLRSSLKGGQLSHDGMSERAITKRVKALGESVGIEGLSAHDCRHYWATAAAKYVNLFQLQEAGGWTNLTTPRRYVEQSAIANDGFTWDEE